jgi:hypothetical protein
VIEKAFAIRGEPGDIWDALWRDLSAGEAGSYEVEAAHRPDELRLRVMLGGHSSRLGYRITPREDGTCEVVASLEPHGLGYKMAQVISFNHIKRNYELILVQGLSNLKKAVEMNEGTGT